MANEYETKLAYIAGFVDGEGCLCELLLPYLKIKQRNAEIILRLVEIGKELGAMRLDKSPEALLLYHEMKTQNLKGVDYHRE